MSRKFSAKFFFEGLQCAWSFTPSRNRNIWRFIREQTIETTIWLQSIDRLQNDFQNFPNINFVHSKYIIGCQEEVNIISFLEANFCKKFFCRSKGG